MTQIPYLFANVTDIEEVYYYSSSKEEEKDKNKILELYQQGLLERFQYEYKIIYRSLKFNTSIDINMFVAATGHYDESWKDCFYKLVNVNNKPKQPLPTFLSYCISLISNYEHKKIAVEFSYDLTLIASNVLWREKNLKRNTTTTPEQWYKLCLKS
jgi:hypothetical protein